MFKLHRILPIAIVLVSAVFFQNCGKMKPSAPADEVVQKREVATVTDVDLPAQPDPTPDVTAGYATKASPVLADRYYIDALFKRIFGPTAAATENAKIREDSTNFGVPCSLYEDYKISKGGKFVQKDAARNCGFKLQSYLTVPMDPGSQVARQAQMAHACSDLTANNVTLQFALAQISGDAVPASNDENVKKAFRLFYRNHPEPTPKVIQSLEVVAPNGVATMDSWRVVLYNICTSSHWQIL